MSNLIISLIAIALVAVTAVIAMFVIGPILEESAIKATAGRLQSEANDIRISAEAFQADTTRKVTSLQELYDYGYLKNELKGYDGNGWQIVNGQAMTAFDTEENARKIMEKIDQYQDEMYACSDGHRYETDGYVCFN